MAEPAGASSPAPRSHAPVVLSCEGVELRFGGLQALGGVDLEVREGEIVGLIGPNGAGKTTLMECISGFQKPDRGHIAYKGVDITLRPPELRPALGIGRTLQNVRLFPYLSVVDNLRVALHRQVEGGVIGQAFRLPSVRKEEKRVLVEAQRIAELFGLDRYTETFASELSYGTLRLVELACVVALQPTMLLLDEPASGISQKETEALGPLLRRIREQTGATILMIEHDMPLVMSLSDWVYCLDAGTVLSTGRPETVQEDPRVIEAYLGTPREQARTIEVREHASEIADEQGTAQRESLLEAEGLAVSFGKVQVLHDVSFRIDRGERVALLGTNGAGKSTVLKAVSRLLPLDAGTVRFGGTDVTGMTAEKVARLGLGHVPGGRGLFPSLSVAENLRMGGYLFDDAKKLDEEIERVTSYFPWLRERRNQTAGTLSGGEQQQLATARALLNRPSVLMIDELSLGLAPIVIEQLMEKVQQLHEEEGIGIVIVEQQATFALGYTDRAYFLEKGEVRYEGASAGLLDRDDLLRSVFLAGAVEGFGAEGAA